MRSRTVTLPLSVVALTLLTAAGAWADQLYSVEGRDSFQIGTHELRSEILYSGKQTLSTVKQGRSTRLVARVRYVRSDQGARTDARGSFESTLLASGEQRDEANRDPDYLTVLNQPFSAKLDMATLRDVSRLRGPVPFDFPSPMTGAPLHGQLRRSGLATIAGEPALGVSFSAVGPMRGALPEHPEMFLTGQITMSGTAYYRLENALLLALDATLKISGALADRTKNDPVVIVYKRTIRAESPAPVKEARATRPPSSSR